MKTEWAAATQLNISAATFISDFSTSSLLIDWLRLWLHGLKSRAVYKETYTDTVRQMDTNPCTHMHSCMDTHTYK